MLIFDLVRGSYNAFSLKGPPHPSILVLDGLTTESLGEDTPAGYFVTGFQFIDHEKLGIIQCFEDYNHLYAFGHDPEQSAFTVTYTVFLGMKCMREEFEDGHETGRHKPLDKYLKARVSKRGDTIEIVMGATTWIAVVQDCTFASADAEINTATVTIAGKVTEVFTC